MKVVAAIVAVVVLVAAPVAIASGLTDTLDQQVNAAVDARGGGDESMAEQIEEAIDEMEPEVFDPGEHMMPQDAITLDEGDIVSYEVDGDELGEPEVAEGLSGQEAEIAANTEGNEHAWDLFAAISSPDTEDLVERFVVFSDGELNILAAVAPQPPDFMGWTVYVDGADLEDEGELVLTMAHEYAHIITLQTDQIEYDDSFLDPSAPLPDCGEQVALPEGCAAPGSYWEGYYREFWEPIEAEHAPIDELQDSGDEDAAQQAVQEFYLDNQDQFVTAYSATNQAEDMAESFSFWMIDDSIDVGPIAREKIEFWNQFPELVELREQARENLGL